MVSTWLDTQSKEFLTSKGGGGKGGLSLGFYLTEGAAENEQAKMCFCAQYHADTCQTQSDGEAPGQSYHSAVKLS